MAKKPEEPKKISKPFGGDFSILSDEKKEEIRKKAQTKVDMEKIKQAEEAYELQMLSQARGETDKKHDAWLDEKEEVRIMLPRLYESTHISIDNKWFWNGHTYNLPRCQAMVIREICANAWKHVDIAITGRDENAYRAKRDVLLNSRNYVNTTSNMQ